MVWKRALEFLYSKIEYVLITLFILGLAGAVGVLPYLSTKFSNSLALEEAKRYTLALSEFRSLYTSEVVARVAGHGIQITHDYLEREGSIPLPATFSILLGERLEALEEGGQVRLYSEYPFPWRKDGGPRDDFEREALRQLKQNPTKPYYRFGEWNGHAVLRYATADTMKEACVSCHNSHPQTPKTGWKTGDLRGILEVIHPLESGTQQVNNILFRLIPVIIVLGGLGIIGLLFAFRKLRQTSQELELQVMQRTESLKGLNQQLQEEAEQRKASESKFRGLFEAAYDALIVVNEQGYIILLNDQVERLVGYSQQELLGRPIELLVPDCFHDNHPNHRASYGATPYRLHTGRQNTELWIKLKNGSECPVEISLSPFEEHGATMVLWTIRDISERTKAEEAIKVLARFPDEYPSPVLRLNKEGVILYANMASKLLLEEWQSAVDQQAPELWYQVIQECFFSNETRELEVWCGSILYSVQIVPVVQTGQVNLYARDITAMKNAQEAFRFLSIQHGQILNSAAEGIYGLDLGGKNTFVNSAGATMVGWELDELLGQSQHALIHHSKPDGTPYPREECPIYATFQDGIPRSHADEVFWRKDGTCFPVEYTTNPIRDDEGSLTGAVVTFRDISERKAAEGALQAAYLDTERLLSAISSILIGVDPMGRISRWNEMAERAFGFPSTVALGQKITEANILWDLSALERGMQDCQTSGATVFLAEVHYTTPSGEEGILSLRLTPVISDGEKEMGCLILGMDVTENRQLQVQ
jgi:PAS domain S-box-containing protein